VSRPGSVRGREGSHAAGPARRAEAEQGVSCWDMELLAAADSGLCFDNDARVVVPPPDWSITVTVRFTASDGRPCPRPRGLASTGAARLIIVGASMLRAPHPDTAFCSRRPRVMLRIEANVKHVHSVAGLAGLKALQRIRTYGEAGYAGARAHRTDAELCHM